jgi:hypothetical protein
MRSRFRLGSTNLALISLYFAPVWAADALHALLSPYGGFDDRAHADATIYVRQIFDFGLDGLMRTSNVLAGTKLVIAVAFLAFLIEFSRAVVVGREPDRGTVNAVLFLAIVGILIWAVPAFAIDDGELIRRSATQLLLVAGSVVVIMAERQISDVAQVAPSRSASLAREDAQMRLAPAAPPRTSRLPRWTAAARPAESPASF